jgi:DNA-binding FadR family transcriptional regulator
MRTLKPIERKSLADAVYEQLRDEIVSGRIEPGETLPSERNLCETLEVNRGAVREALKKLEAARLVQIQHGGGTRVLNFRETAGTDLLVQLLVRPDGKLEPGLLRGVMELRTALAVDIARRCARRVPQTGEKLNEIAELMETQRGSAEELMQSNMTFWSEMVDAADNLAYALAFNSVRDVYERFGVVIAWLLADELDDIEAHREIARAVSSGDPDEAEYSARDLVSRGEVRIDDIIEKFGDLMGGQP